MKVFLSYSTSEQELARHLRMDLAEAGFDVRDPFATLLPGDNLGTQIETALEESDAMVVLLSPDAKRSPYVSSEIQYALGSPRYKNRVIPVLVHGSVEAPWADYVQVLDAGERSAGDVSRLVIEALGKTATPSRR